jgi:uncharacterized protein
MLNANEIIILLNSKKQEMKEKYFVSSIALFGSYARSEQTPESDIDILVDFEKPLGLKFIDLADDLEKLFQKEIDLICRKELRQSFFNNIETDLRYV